MVTNLATFYPQNLKLKVLLQHEQHKKVLLSSYHLYDHTLGFHQQNFNVRTRGVFHHLAKMSGLTGWNAPRTHREKGHALEQTEDLRRYSTFSVPTDWSGNYRSICRKFEFLLLTLTQASGAFMLGSFICLSFWNQKFLEFQTENFG